MSKFLRATVLLVATVFLSFNVAQAALSVTVTYTGSAPAGSTLVSGSPFSTLAAAIVQLNASTFTGTTSVTLTCSASGIETAPVIGATGGYQVTAAGSGTCPIIINGNGSTITAATGLTAGTLTDGIFKLIGASYVTLENFTLQENSSNTVTAAASNTMTEWGIAFLYNGTTNKGCQNNTVTGNTITLNNTYLNSFGIYGNTNHTSAGVTSSFPNTVSAVTGANSNNTITSNNISNVNIPIALVGFSNTSFMDLGNVIGSTALNGNTCTNWGTGTPASAFYDAPGYTTGLPYQGPSGIFLANQTGFTANYNTLTSNTVPAGTHTWGINVSHTLTPTTTYTDNITGNTISVNSATTSGSFGMFAIFHTTGSASATLNITNNNIQNCTITGTSSSSPFFGVYNTGNIATLAVTGNNIYSGNTTTATSGGAGGTGITTSFCGVYNSGSVTSAISLNTNTIGETFSAINSSTSYGIDNINGTSAATLQIDNNIFQNFSFPAGGTTNLHFIDNAANTKNQDISSNNFNNIASNASGAVYLINNVALGGAGTKSINSNFINTGFATASNGSVYFYNETGNSATSSNLQYQNNNFSEFNDINAGTIVGMNILDGSTNAKSITGNTFSDIFTTSSATILAIAGQGTNTVSGNSISNINGGTAVNGISFTSSAGTNNVSFNTINGLFSSSTSGAVVTGIINSGSSAVYNITGNTITSIIVAGGTPYGIKLGASGAETVTKNNVSYVSTATAGDAGYGIWITNGTSGCTIAQDTVSNGSTVAFNYYGIYFSMATGTISRVYQNVIHDLSNSTGNISDDVFGIYLLGGGSTGTDSVYQNKVYSLSGALDGIYGIYDASGDITYVYNNVIGQLSSNCNGSGTFAIIGLVDAGNGTNVNKFYYYNTVYLSGTIASSAVSACIYETGSATAGATNLTLADNILVNDMTPASGSAYCMYRTNVSFLNYNINSNNNLFYAGGTTGSHYICDANGTTYQSLANYVSAAGGSKDAASVTQDEAANFISTTGTSANFLNLLPQSGNGCFNAGAIEPFITDYLGLVRAPNTNTGYLGAGTVAKPTIGAYEVIKSANDAGVLSLVSPSLCAGSQSVQVVVSNFGTATLTGVTVNWSINGVAQTPYAATGLNVASGANTTLTLGSYAFTTGSATIVASTTLPNGAADANPNNDSYTQTFGIGLSGTYTIGSGYNYATLGAAIADYNAAPICGNVTFLLQSNYTSSAESFPFNIFTNAGATGPNHYTLTVKPAAGTTQNIAGSSSTGIFLLNGAQYVTIDGSNAVGGTSQDLAITNSNNTAATVLIVNSASNNTVENCIVKGNALTTANYPGIIDVFLPTTTAASTNNTIQNNSITSNTVLAGYGIYLLGTTGEPTSNTNITGNTIYSFGTAGIYDAGFSTGEQITNNTIYNNYAAGTYATTTYGINYASTGAAVITGNSIYGVGTATATTQYGINITSGPSSGTGHTVWGNYIGGSAALATGTWTNSHSPATFYGIFYSKSASTAVANIFSNTVSNISLTSTGANSFTGIDVGGGYAGIGASGGAGNTVSNITTGTSGNTGNNLIYGILGAGSGIVHIRYNTVTGITNNSTGTTANMFGVAFTATGAGDSIIYNNINTLTSSSKCNLDVANTATANTSAAICGIEITPASGSGILCGYNTIYTLISNAAAAANYPSVVGIGSDNANTASFMFNNKIYDLENNSTNTATSVPGIAGIRLYDGAWTVYNNQVILTNTTLAGTALTNGVKIYGIMEMSGSANAHYFNSVYIGGGANTGAGISSAWDLSYITSTPFLVKNNIFYNVRTNTGTASGNNYAITVMKGGTGTAPTTVQFTADYNELYSAGTAANFLGQKGSAGTNYTNAQFSTWKSVVPVGDANSLSQQAYFSQSNPPTSDLTPSNTSNCLLYGKGLAITSGTFPPSSAGISKDYALTSRPSPPNVGAIEFTNSFPTISAGSAQSACAGSTITLAGTNVNDGIATGAWTPTGGGLTYSNTSAYNSTLSGYAITPGTTLTWTVTDGSCSGNNTVVITATPLPTATISGTITTCSATGTTTPVTFTGANGTPPYTFTYTINGGSNQTIATTSGSSVTINVPTTSAAVTTYALVSVQESSAQACSQNQSGNAVVTVNSCSTTLTVGAGTSFTGTTYQPGLTSANTTPSTNGYLLGFSLSASSPTTVAGLTLNLTGNATASDYSNIRLINDADGSGTWNTGDVVVATVASLPTVPGTLSFGTLSESIGATATNYLVVADVLCTSTSGKTLTAALSASSSGVTTSATVAGTTQTGNSMSVGSLPATPGNPTVSPSATCAVSSPVTISESGSPSGSDAWYWESTATGTSTANNASASENESLAATYYIRAQNSTGCWSSSAGSVAVTFAPTITLGLNPTGVCAGTNASLTYSATTYAPNQYSITWDATALSAGFVNVSNVTLPGSISIATPATATTGTYNATLTVTNTTSSCTSGNYPITVGLLTTPTAVTVLPTSTTTCGSTTLTASGGTNGTIYWQNTTSNGTSTATASSSQTVSASATYYFNAQAVGGCWSTQGSSVVTINPLPSVTLGTPTTVCPGTASSVTYTGATNTPNKYSIVWNGAAITAGFANVTNATLSSPISITTPSGAAGTTYSGTLTVTNSTTTCSNTGYPLNVTLNPVPSVSIGASPSTAAICGGTGNVVMTANGSGGTGTLTYSWSPTTNLQPVAGTSSIETSTATVNRTYTVTVKDANLCSVTASQAVTIASAITVAATATPTTVCAGGSSQLIANVANANGNYGVSSIAYSAPTPASPTTISTFTSGTDDGYAAITIPFAFNFYGTPYTTVYAGTNGYVAFTSSTARTPGLLPNTSAPTNIIAPFFEDLDLTYSGNITYYTLGVAPNRQFVISYNAVPIYNSGYSGSTTFNSTNTNTGQVILYEGSNNINVLIVNSPSATKVAGIENLGGTKATPATGRNDVSWTVSTPEAWQFTPASVTYNWNPGTYLSSTSTYNPTASAIASTTNYSVTATDATTGCSASATASITTSALSASAGSPVTICPSASTTLTAVPTGGCSPYTYNWGSGYTSTATNSVSPTVTTSYTVTIQDNNSSTASASVTVTVNPAVTAAITPLPANAVSCAGSLVKLTAAGGGGNGSFTYTWAPTTNLTPVAGNVAIESATPTTNRTYTVTVKDGNNCTATASQTVNYSTPPTTQTVTGTAYAPCASGATLSLSSSQSGVNYQLTLAGVNQGSAVAGTGSAITLPGTHTAGSYVIVATNASGCTTNISTTVTTIGVLSGNVTVGTSGTYTTLTGSAGLFNAINSGYVSGNIVATINSNITEPGTIALNQWTEVDNTCTVTATPSYTLTVQSDGSVRTLSGNYSTDYLIRLQGADRVTFTGGTGSQHNLVINNLANGVMLYIDDCTSDLLTNCDIQGGSVSGEALAVGSTGATASITISNNKIHDINYASGQYPDDGIFINNPDAAITISGNSIYNFTYYGIHVLSSADNSIISGNNLYMAFSDVNTNGAIYDDADGNGHTITNNTIGGNGSGGNWVYTAANATNSDASNTEFDAIYYAGAEDGAAATITGNTIGNFSFTATSPPYFYGIHSSDGAVTIGSSGNSNVISNVTVGASGAGDDEIFGISVTDNGSTDPVSIQYNSIHDLTSQGTTADASSSIFSKINGIYFESYSTNGSINNNTIYNLVTPSRMTNSIATTNDDINDVVSGILVYSYPTGINISANTLYGLRSTVTTTKNTVVSGIAISDGTNASAGSISSNKIYDLTNTSTGTSTLPAIVGIRIYETGVWNVYNNQLILTNGTNVNGMRFYGISDYSGAACNYFYNSVYMGGGASSGVAVSAAYNGFSALSSPTFYNNLLYNERTNTGSATGINYAIDFQGASPIGFTSDYNNLYSVSTTGSTTYNNVGLKNTAAAVALSNWQPLFPSPADAHSQSKKVIFNQSTPPTSDLTPNSLTNCWLDGKGKPVVTPAFAIAVPKDYLNTNTRNATTPDIGAIEFTSSDVISLTLASGANSSTTSLAVCSGSTVSSTVATNALPALAYSWSTPDAYAAGNVTTFSRSATAPVAGAYTVSVTDVLACTFTATATLVVNPIPTATISGTVSVCRNSTAPSVTFTGANGTAPYTFTYNINGVGSFTATTTSGNSITVSVPTSATGTFAYNLLSVQDASSTACSQTQSGTATITVNQIPTVTASNTGPYVVGQTIDLSASATGVTGYLWTGPNGYSASGALQTISGATTAMAGIYSVTVTNAATCTATASTNVAVTTTATYTWTGTTSTDWTDPSNWIPTSPIGGPNACALDVIIPSVLHNPVISSAVAIGNLQMNSGSQLTLNGANISVCKNLAGGTGNNAAVIGNGVVVLTGSTLQTITGYFSMQELMLSNGAGASMLTNSAVDLYTSLDLQTGNFDATNGNLTFKSNTVDSVAILDNFSPGYSGNISGNITAERYYASSTTEHQHYMGSPVNSPSIAGQFGASGTAGRVIDTYCDETQINYNSAYGTVFQLDQHGGINCGIEQWVVLTSGNAQNGLGYSLLKPGTGKLVLNGGANLDANYQISGLQNTGWTNTTMQGRPQRSGWQLLSNPYLATLELSTVPTGFDNQVQIWNAEGPYAGTYQPGLIGTNAVVAPFQGFMVHKTAVGGAATFTINAADRVRTPATFYQQNANELKIVAANNTTGLLDQTTVAFNNAATDTFDAQYDAQKMAGSLGRHTIYTLNNNKWMAINALNNIATTSTVPVGFEPGKTGAFTFSFNGINTFDATSYVYLEDRATTQWYNVRNGNYTFNADSADEWNRFVLHFTPPTQIITVDATCNTAGTINIQQPGSAYWNYALLDSNNAIVTTGTLNEAEPVTIQVPSGSYRLTLTDTNNYVAVKAIQVNGPSPVSADFLISADTVEPQQTVVLTATTPGAASYQWDLGNGTDAAGSWAMVNYTQPGVYVLSLLVTNQTGCSSTQTHTITVINASATGLNTLNGTGHVKIWSNENKVYVDFNNLHLVGANVIIYDILGQQISNENVTTQNLVYQKEISNIEASYFIVMVKNDDKITAKKVFIINSK